MRNCIVLMFVVMTVPFCLSIECYTGQKLIAGQVVGTDTIKCENSNAYCYNMTANAAIFIDIVKAGCSLWRCMLARDKCVSAVFQNIPISLCCCSTDRCNLVEEGLRQQKVKGWNMEPNEGKSERIKQWRKEEVAHKFQSVDLDDDQPSTSRGYGNGLPVTTPQPHKDDLRGTISPDYRNDIPNVTLRGHKDDLLTTISRGYRANLLNTTSQGDKEDIASATPRRYTDDLSSSATAQSYKRDEKQEIVI